MTITPSTALWIAGSGVLVAILTLLYSVHKAQKREYGIQASKVASLEAGLSATRRQVDHLTDDHKSFKEEVSHAIERVYDKIGSVHDLVVQIALKDKENKP